MLKIGILSTKGGSGKSTLATHLAAWIETTGKRVGILDADPQGSAALWHRQRESETPVLAQVSADQVPGFKADGMDVVIIDSAPAHSMDVRTIAAACDFVVIPSRPQVFDLDGIRTAVEQVLEAGTPGGILLNACPPGRGYKESSITMDARRTLASWPMPVAPVSVTQRATFAHALINGAAAHEFEPDGKAAREIAAVWQWIERETA